MTNQEIKVHVRQLISRGQTDEALETLLEHTTKAGYNKLANELRITQTTFKENERAYRTGTISRDIYMLTRAQVTQSILNIVDEMPNDGTGGNEGGGDSAQLNILFLTARPTDVDDLRLGDEYRKVVDEVKGDTLSFRLEPSVRITTIIKAIDQNNPDILHFSGHGSGKEGLLVQAEDGTHQLFPTPGLDRMFASLKKNIKCVVLNACYSKEQAEVISQHGIHVVGMKEPIGDHAAIAFSVGFYQGLSSKNDYIHAFDRGMINISPYLGNADTPQLWLNGRVIKE